MAAAAAVLRLPSLPRCRLARECVCWHSFGQAPSRWGTVTGLLRRSPPRSNASRCRRAFLSGEDTSAASPHFQRPLNLAVPTPPSVYNAARFTSALSTRRCRLPCALSWWRSWHWRWSLVCPPRRRPSRQRCPRSAAGRAPARRPTSGTLRGHIQWVVRCPCANISVAESVLLDRGAVALCSWHRCFCWWR